MSVLSLAWIGPHVSAATAPPQNGVPTTTYDVYGRMQVGPQGVDDPIQGVAFSSDGTHGIAVGYGLGGGAVIFASSDGGATWDTSPVPGGLGISGLASVSFAPGSSTVAYAVGSGSSPGVSNTGGAATTGIIVATSDGGATWHQEAVPAGPYLLPVLWSVSAVSSTEAFASGAECGSGYRAPCYTAVVQTTTGGASWTELSLPLDQVEPPDFANDAGRGISFATPSNGWVVGNDLSSGPIVTSTADGGATWTTRDLWSIAPFAYPTSVSLVNASQGSIGGYVNGSQGDLGTILSTSDGGTSWTTSTFPTRSQFLGVSRTDAQHGIAVGWCACLPTYVAGGLAYNPVAIVDTTNDGGLTWSAQQIPDMAPPAGYSTSDGLYAVASGSGGKVWTGGYGACGDMMLTSSDSGASWQTRLGCGHPANTLAPPPPPPPPPTDQLGIQGLSAPTNLAYEAGVLTPPLAVTATIIDYGSATSPAASVTIVLPFGLQLAPGESATHPLGDISSGNAVTTVWRIVASNAGGPYSIKVTATDSGNPPSTAGASITVNVPPMPTVVFIHGIKGNAAQVQRGSGYNALLNPMRAKYGASDITYFFYYQDKGYADQDQYPYPCPSIPSTASLVPPGLQADTNIGPLVGHPDTISTSTNAGLCDSQGALAYSSAALDGLLQNVPQHTAVIANSMGAAITRGWLVLAQDKASHYGDISLNLVDTVTTFEGAQQGSWLGNIQPVLDALPPVLSPIATSIATAAARQQEIDPNRPGTRDLFAQSDWYQTVNQHLVPSQIKYFNFYGDELLHANGYFFFVPTFSADAELGDTVMMPGSSNPYDVPVGGGSRFLPDGVNGPSQHEYASVTSRTMTLQAGVGGPGNSATGATVMGDPLNHQNYGNHMADGSIAVDACDGSGTTTPTAEILRVLASSGAPCQ